jgi:hypothetical protein
MAGERRIRASDADRDRTAALLREHHVAGRLTAEEFSERLDKAYAAKTLGELDDLLADLPAIDLYQLPDASLRRPPSPPGAPPLPWLLTTPLAARLSPAWRAAWCSWLSASLLMVVIWLASGHPSNLWFLWVVGPWGVILFGRWITGGPPRSCGPRRRRDW